MVGHTSTGVGSALAPEAGHTWRAVPSRWLTQNWTITTLLRSTVMEIRSSCWGSQPITCQCPLRQAVGHRWAMIRCPTQCPAPRPESKAMLNTIQAFHSKMSPTTEQMLFPFYEDLRSRRILKSEV